MEKSVKVSDKLSNELNPTEIESSRHLNCDIEERRSTFPQLMCDENYEKIFEFKDRKLLYQEGNNFIMNNIEEEIGNISKELNYQIDEDDISSNILIDCSVKNETDISNYGIQITENVLNIKGPDSIQKCLSRSWNMRSITSISSIQFFYVHFNTLIPYLPSLLQKFSHVSQLSFVNANIHSLYQLNTFGQFHDINSLSIGEGNPVTSLSFWKMYLIFRLNGQTNLNSINGVNISDIDKKEAENMFGCLASTTYSQLPMYRLSAMVLNPCYRQEFHLKDSPNQTSLQRDICSSAIQQSNAKAVLMYTSTFNQKINEISDKCINSFVDNCLKKALGIKMKRENLPNLLNITLLEIMKEAVIDYNEIDKYASKQYNAILHSI